MSPDGALSHGNRKYDPFNIVVVYATGLSGCNTKNVPEQAIAVGIVSKRVSVYFMYVCKSQRSITVNILAKLLLTAMVSGVLSYA